jgi:hypothetical protein
VKHLRVRSASLVASVGCEYLANSPLVQNLRFSNTTARVIINSQPSTRSTAPTQWWHNLIGVPLKAFQSGPLSKTEQTIDWDELIEFKANACCNK